MRRRPLFWQIFPSMFALIVISYLAIFIFAYAPINQYFFSKTSSDLKERLLLVKAGLVPIIAQTPREGWQAILQGATDKFGTRITLISETGVVFADSLASPETMDNHIDRPEVALALVHGYGESIRGSNTLEAEMMYYSERIDFDKIGHGVLRVAISMSDFRSQVTQVYYKILLVGLVLLVAVGLISYLFSRRVSRPLEQMKGLAERISRGDFSGRVQLKPTDTLEAHKLGQAMNEIAVQLDHRIETILNQKNERDAILGSMVEGVLAVDPDEKIVHLNKAAAEILQISRLDAIGKSVPEAIRLPEIQNLIQQSILKDYPEEIDIHLQVNDDEKILQIQSSPLRSVYNSRLGAVFVFSDITKLKRLERHRSDFVANVSHELRTPLTSIRGFAETLMNPKVKESERSQFIEIIHKHADRLGEIIEDLLALSRLEKDHENQEIELKKDYLWSSIKSAKEMCEIKAAKLGVHINIDGEQMLQAEINAPLLEQAVLNLIDNAAKYSKPGGEIKIKLYSKEKWAVIAVSDNGPGIAKVHLPRLFERFYRIDKARSRQLGGTGLGLSIVKHVALAHRGEVSVESELGKGSIFYIKVPYFTSLTES